jgi:hypothetical protein
MGGPRPRRDWYQRLLSARIAVSAAPLPRAEFDRAWDSILGGPLQLLEARNPERPIVFTEFGYTDSVGSPFVANADEFTGKRFTDVDGNRIDDGEEQQQRAIESFFDAMARYPGLVHGAFLWDHQMTTQIGWGFGL